MASAGEDGAGGLAAGLEAGRQELGVGGQAADRRDRRRRVDHQGRALDFVQLNAGDVGGGADRAGEQGRAQLKGLAAQRRPGENATRPRHARRLGTVRAGRGGRPVADGAAPTVLDAAAAIPGAGGPVGRTVRVAVRRAVLDASLLAVGYVGGRLVQVIEVVALRVHLLRGERAAGAQQQHVGRALGERRAERYRLGHAGVVEAAAAELDRRPRQEGQRRAGPQRQPQLHRADEERPQVGRLPRLRVRPERVVLDRTGQDRREVHRPFRLVHLLDERADVDDGPTAQQRRPADQRLRVVRVGPAAQPLRLGAQQPRPGERPRRGPVDRIEGGDHAELVQRQRHPGRHGPPHAAALDREHDPVRIRPPSGHAPRPHAFLDELKDFVHPRNRTRCRRGGTGRRGAEPRAFGPRWGFSRPDCARAPLPPRDPRLQLAV